MVPTSLTEPQRQLLLNIAKDSIAEGLKSGKPLRIKLENYAEQLTVLRATFVTLEIKQRLRGCIGMLEAVRPLVLDVAENAFAAAFRDPRFPPLSAEEAAKLAIHLSILSPSTPLVFTSEQDLIAQLRPGVDGLIMEEGGRRGTFLPAVWQSLPEPKQFLQHLKQKTGLPLQYWSETLKVSRYQCDVI
jgi:AmmeMemoRadiSam system protein A